MDFSILSSFLPEGLLSHFDIVDFKELGNLQSKKDCFYIYLDEKNILPKGYDSNKFESKGFYERTIIQDFPIRGKAVYLGIRRRRWRNIKDKSVTVKSDYSFIAEGSKITVELSDFLKDTGRDPRRYDK
ncbi:MAG: ISAon1 family transposase N-terminal region protein [Bacteroidia bacterium]